MGGKKLPITILYKEKKLNLLPFISLLVAIAAGITFFYWGLEAKLEKPLQKIDSKVWVQLDGSSGYSLVKAGPAKRVEKRVEKKITRPIWPIEGKIAKDFGWRKETRKSFEEWQYVPGLDLAAVGIQEVKAILPGSVELVEKNSFGYMITMNHGGHLQSIYGNCIKSRVKPGERVEQGQAIAQVKGTLHFRLLRNGQPFNPKEYLPN